MRFFFFFAIFTLPLFCGVKKDIIFHKTIGKIEIYKEKETVKMNLGRVRRLTKNLLTPIHKRDLILNKKVDKHLLTMSKEGPLTISFLLPLSMKKDILELLSKNKLILSIPFGKGDSLQTSHVEMDRHANPPKGLFAMRSIIETDVLSPSALIFIHLLKDET